MIAALLVISTLIGRSEIEAIVCLAIILETPGNPDKTTGSLLNPRSGLSSQLDLDCAVCEFYFIDDGEKVS